MSDPVARGLDGLSRRDHDTRPDDLVFSLGHNLPFHHDTARKRFYAALELAGLGRLRAKNDPIVFHDLRHTGERRVDAPTTNDCPAFDACARRVAAWGVWRTLSLIAAVTSVVVMPRRPGQGHEKPRWWQ
jgi:hypothetical protein